ncbi:MAG: hypothetical protein ABIL76_07985 [candidate division WOR-3 bacterium]
MKKFIKFILYILGFIIVGILYLFFDNSIIGQRKKISEKLKEKLDNINKKIKDLEKMKIKNKEEVDKLNEKELIEDIKKRI